MEKTTLVVLHIKKEKFHIFERGSAGESTHDPSDYKSDAIPLDQGGFVKKNAVLQVLYYVRAESMKLLPSRRGPPVARTIVFGVSDAKNNATRDRWAAPAWQQLH